MKSKELKLLLNELDKSFMISRNGGFGFYNLSLSDYADKLLPSAKQNIDIISFMEQLVGQIQIEELIEKYSPDSYYLINFASSQSQLFQIEDDIKRLNNYAKMLAQQNQLAEKLEVNLQQGRRFVNKKTEKDQSGYIYLIKSELGCKIGKTKNIKQREKLFTVKMPFQFHFEDYKKCHNYNFIETELHAKYNDKRINGEWFDLSDNDIMEIKAYLAEIEI